WISSDVGNAVHRFHHLTRPSISNFADEWKMIARPASKFGEALFAIRCLAALVIFAANDEHVADRVACKSNVVIWNRSEFLLFLFRCRRGVPQKRSLYFASHAKADDVRSIRRLL